jgi:hypothetical protein
MSVYREAGAGYLARTKDLTPRVHAMRRREEGVSPDSGLMMMLKEQIESYLDVGSLARPDSRSLIEEVELGKSRRA